MRWGRAGAYESTIVDTIGCTAARFAEGTETDLLLYHGALRFFHIATVVKVLHNNNLSIGGPRASRPQVCGTSHEISQICLQCGLNEAFLARLEITKL
jgi:hypothetical protein